MKKDIMVLKDGTSIEIEATASLDSVGVVSPDKPSMLDAWDRLTGDNLSEVQVKDGDGVLVGSYTGLALVSETSTVQEDGTVLTQFRFREKSGLEKRMDALEKELETHTGAIDDLGVVTSALAEAQERGMG